MSVEIIHLHPQAPRKPAEGEACNGCGVCCASEPCPAGVLVSGRRRGACDALQWTADPDAAAAVAGGAAGRYRCGLVDEPQRFLPRVLHGAAPIASRLALRLISAGSGCDCSLQVGTPAQADHP